MEYRYKNIYLEETIEEIFPELNNSNTEYKRSIFVLLYKPYENIEVYIYLKFGKVRLIKIFDENFQIDNTLKVGIALTDAFATDRIKNYLECKNLLDIYGSLYWSKTLDANIEKREIYGQLDNYKFTFDMITRDIKSIQNLETGEYVKISLE